MMDKYKVKEEVEHGVKMNLMLPDGSLSEDYLMVLSTYSSAYKQEENKLLREAALKRKELADSGKTLSEDEQWEYKQSSNLRLLSSLVTGWSFKEQEFSKQNLIDWLKEAPTVQDQLDFFSQNHKAWFAAKLRSSSDGTKQS